MKKIILPLMFMFIGYVAATIVTMSRVFANMNLTSLANFYFLGVIPVLILAGLGAYIYAAYSQTFIDTENANNKINSYPQSVQTEEKPSEIIEPYDMEKYQAMKAKLMDELDKNPEKAAERLLDYMKGRSA